MATLEQNEMVTISFSSSQTFSHKITVNISTAVHIMHTTLATVTGLAYILVDTVKSPVCRD